MNEDCAYYALEGLDYLLMAGKYGNLTEHHLEEGLILINAGADIIRFVPPLVITRENVDEMIAILDTCIE